jgi:hypothetical protein
VGVVDVHLEGDVLAFRRRELVPAPVRNTIVRWCATGVHRKDVGPAVHRHGQPTDDALAQQLRALGGGQDLDVAGLVDGHT